MPRGARIDAAIPINCIAIGALASLGGIAYCFPSLFSSGRIWAEEGTLFLHSILQVIHGSDKGSLIYLHNGHWDLWTNIAAFFAAAIPSRAPFIFTWLSAIPHVIVAVIMGSYALSQIETKRHRELAALIIGAIALVVNGFVGGPETFFNTTNTQWILCVYVFFRLHCLDIRTGANLNSSVRKFISPIQWLDGVVMLSSFAGSILFPIQLTFKLVSTHRGYKRVNILQCFMVSIRERLGLSIGFMIQFATTALLASKSASGRGLDIVNATMGFMIQGLAGMFIPSSGPLQALSDAVSGDSMLYEYYLISLCSFLVIVILVCLRGNTSSIASMIVLTFIFCQLALNDKLAPAMRYLAPQRIVIVWLLLTQVFSRSLSSICGSATGALSMAMAITISLTSASYYSKNALIWFGMQPGGCQSASVNATKKFFGAPRVNTMEALPICPEGWYIDLSDMRQLR